MILDKPRNLFYQWSTQRKNDRWFETLEAHLKTNNPVLVVYQMGRAGSMTTVNSLRSAGCTLPVFHAHWLNPDTVQKRLDRIRI